MIFYKYHNLFFAIKSHYCHINPFIGKEGKHFVSIKIKLLHFSHTIDMVWILRKIFKIAGNFYWKIFGGIFLASIWFVLGFILLFTVVGFPYSMQCFRISWLTYKPFGKNLVLISNHRIASFLWFVSIGWILGSISVLNAILSCATIVGFPLLGQWLKVCRLAFFPFCGVWK